MDTKRTVAEIDRLFPQYQADLGRLVAANSKNRPDEGPGLPFGKGARQALDAMLAIAQRMGFETHVDPEGYYGYAEVGAGAEMLGVLGHLDVVPADDAENWHTPPFTLTEKDGILYGRGVQDDKGPTLASMYALRLLLDSGATLTKRVRFIYCIDEETLWISVKKYAEKEEHPSMGFTPDANFPLLFAEKGLVEYSLVADEAESGTLAGGSAYNAVPGSAKTPYDPKVEQALKDLGYEYRRVDGELEAIGKTVHALAADEGVNAVTRLATAIVKAGVPGAMLRYLAEKADDPNGLHIFGPVQDEYSGKLTLNVGLADIKPGKQTLGIDIRFPVSVPKAQIDEGMAAGAKPYGVRVEPFDYLAPLHIATDGELVQDLMRAYQEVTGDTTTKPMATGGATFARSMPNIVAFGSLLPGAPDTEHQPNEQAAIADIKTAIRVYLRAFELLCTEGK